MHNAGGPRTRTSKKHESIEALLSAHGERKPKDLIRRLAREMVAYAKAQGWEGPPFCPKILAGIFGIRCKEVHHDIDGDGRILPYRDGKLWIEYRSGVLAERQRFTIFHELAHTLFPDFCETLPRNHAPAKKTRSPEKEFESLCDIGAAEMLFPHEEFLRDLAGSGKLRIELIHTLRRRYEGSIDATTHRLIDLVDGTACAAAFFTDIRPQLSGAGLLWVQYPTQSKTFKGYLTPGTKPPPNSVVLECYRNSVETTIPAKETWWVNGYPRTYLVQAARLPAVENPEYSKVVALFLPAGYK